MSELPDAVIDIYARQSRMDDDRQRSPEGQVEDCRAILEDRGLTAGEVHIDSGLSAWNPRIRRPGWRRLMERLESGEAGGVVVFDLERFSRQPDDGSRLIKAAEHGLLILDSDSEYDVMSPSGRKSFRDALSTAEYYSMQLSKRVRRGKKLKASKGEPNGSARPFGFEPDLITVRESEAEVLRDLAARFLAGESQDALLADLNARGILTSYGKPWTRAGLRQVLIRPRNCGQIVYKTDSAGEPKIVGRLPGDPILTEEEWGRVCSAFTARKRGRPNSPVYMCSGIAACGLCGRPLHGRPRANLRAYPDGDVKREYWCGPSTGGGCGRLAIDQRGLDEHARELVIAVLSDPGHAAAIEAAARDGAGRAAELDREITLADDDALVIAGRFGRGEISRARYDAATIPLDERIAKLRAERAALDTPSPPPAAVSRAAWESRWESAEPAERRALLKTALRGRRLVVEPADPSDRTNVAGRLRVEPVVRSAKA